MLFPNVERPAVPLIPLRVALCMLVSSVYPLFWFNMIRSMLVWSSIYFSHNWLRSLAVVNTDAHCKIV